MKKNILFIINPISGGKSKDQVPGLISENLDSNIFEHHIIFTNAPKQAGKIALENIYKFDIIVAVGGDGTVNEIASVMVGTGKTFGILPYGSGNGLSRFLEIPMDTAGAIKSFNYLNTQTIDGAQLNGKWFFNVAGMGFDAHIADVFARHKHRGFFTYVRSAFSEVLNYKSHRYNINIDGNVQSTYAFMLSFANSSQYGNNAHISPTASVQDGLIDVCVIKPFPLYRFVEMGLRMFFKKAESSKYVKVIKGKQITVTRDEPGPVHIDGEPITLGKEIEVQIKPASLNIIVGKDFS
ncbi:diacylglycerol/lipid kinase family protein [Mucilaginibacter ginkgonis]|uniref:Diacylglycerol kinase family lipid kinase n=1 Tax=Mucilaginibacter ginkgonis TaxID=2682091 RepID=A0A6I4HYT0_9SPHI|nr:diacylglycerol kinase family protein [Mucilaginibacter ginkgonis]QQL49668.1 diacylglycerol kinase family lipid kinase [Mucilaginibacter ginkgonis]